MKAKLASLLSAFALFELSLPAANIAWVSLHPADNTPSANAASVGYTNAPDKGYTQLLTANGHTVTRFLSVEGIQNFPDELAGINTNDVVIIGRSVNSAHYDSTAEVSTWNGINKPMIIMSGYLLRNSRLGFTTGTTIPDASSNPMRLKVNAIGHPIFAGTALSSTNLMVNPYSQRVIFTNATSGVTTLQLGISVNNNTLPAGGTVLATVGTAGDAALNGMVVGEFPPGVTTAATVGATVLPARRLVLLTGSREAAPVNLDGAGIYDLFADGGTILLNAVTYLTTPQLPKCTLPLVGATNLVAADSWTFSAGPIGDLPISYQWYKDGAPLVDATNAGLAFASLDLTNAGQYQLYLTNANGWSTSTLASLSFVTLGPANITNSMISYWPLDGSTNSKTPDVVSSYDMTMVNMTATNIVGGKWSNSIAFENGKQSLLQRVHAGSDALPIYQHPTFTISMWVNGGPQSDHRVFAESSTTNINTVLDLGTHNNGTDGTVDVFIRSDNNVNSQNHGHSTATAFDNSWHNIVYVQRDVSGAGSIKAQLWVDGVLDPLAINSIRPITANNTAIGGWLRASASSWFTGLIDEVAVWNRPLSATEIGILQVTPITNPPVRIQPLAINSFKADLPAVVSGGSTTLRWDVSKDVTQVTLTTVGDVTGQTSVGVGSQSITPPQSTNYVLTVTRGVDTISATTSVAVVTGVNPGWKLLDNFEQTPPGNLASAGYWNDTSGTAGQVVNVYSNRAARTTSSGISYLNLRGLSIQETQACSLFFRIIAGNNATGVTNIVGLTDKSQRNYADEYFNIGPVLYAAPFTNSGAGIDTNGWYLGARNGYNGGNSSPAADYPVPALDTLTVYNVWIDITNAPLAESANDTFTVYIQKEGGPPRTVLFQDYTSDRDPLYIDPVLGGIAPNLDKLVLMGNSATVSCIFDDFYLSSGYNSTIPKPSAFVLPPGPVSIVPSGNQLQISWSNGTLQSSTNVIGPYVDVPGSPVSPLLVTPIGDQLYYRSRQ